MSQGASIECGDPHNDLVTPGETRMRVVTLGGNFNKIASRS